MLLLVLGLAKLCHGGHGQPRAKETEAFVARESVVEKSLRPHRASGTNTYHSSTHTVCRLSQIVHLYRLTDCKSICIGTEPLHHVSTRVPSVSFDLLRTLSNNSTQPALHGHVSSQTTTAPNPIFLSTNQSARPVLIPRARTVAIMENVVFDQPPETPAFVEGSLGFTTPTLYTMQHDALSVLTQDANGSAQDQPVPPKLPFISENNIICWVSVSF